MPIKSNEARSSEIHARAEARFSKEDRARDGAQAMTEYQAQGRAIRERMAQLRALRLDKEAADKENAEQEPLAKETAAKGPVKPSRNTGRSRRH